MTDTIYQRCDISQAMTAVNKLSGWDVDSPHDLMKALEGHQSARWSNIDGWEDMLDTDIFDCIKQLDGLEGSVFVISEASYRGNRGAFNVNHGQLKNFAANHLKLFGESLFNGDVLFIDVDQSVIFAFHHEGGWARFDLRST